MHMKVDHSNKGGIMLFKTQVSIRLWMLEAPSRQNGNYQGKQGYGGGYGYGMQQSQDSGMYGSN
ncbi:hypothetical protein Tco_1425142, partial [Tanacetum coccineum]